MGRGNSRISTAYQKAKASGQSTYRWEGSKAKEGKNIQISWTKALENTIKHFCTVAKKVEKQAEQARLEASKNMIKAGGSQTIAVTGTMSFGAVLDALISSGMSAGAAEGLASKLISLAAEAAGPIAVVLGGTAILWWLLPMEAGESEEQATAWMAKEDQKKNDEKESSEEKPKNPQRVDDKYLKKKGISGHKVKKEYFGKKADIAKYDIYVDKATGRLWIYLKHGRGVPIPTDYYIK